LAKRHLNKFPTKWTMYCPLWRLMCVPTPPWWKWSVKYWKKTFHSSLPSEWAWTKEIAKKFCAKVTILSVRSGLNCFCYRDHQFRYDTCLIIRNSTDRKGQIPNGHHNITVAAYRYYCTFIGYRGNWWFPTAQSIVLQRIFHSVVNVTSTICRMI